MLALGGTLIQKKKKKTAGMKRLKEGLFILITANTVAQISFLSLWEVAELQQLSREEDFYA